MTMEFRFLGKTGLQVSELCLGAMTFGREASEADSHAMLDRFVAAGGNFVDTADVYSRGASEQILGNWLAKKPREEIVIATKGRWGTDDPDNRRPNQYGLSRKHLIAACDASLKRLRTDYIDLYQVHMWDPSSRLEETLATLDGLVKSGKIRYVGASNYSGWQLQKSIDLAKANGWEPFTCLQALYNLLDRDSEYELLYVVRNEALGMIPWSPLRGGWLAGRYKRGMNAAVPGTRIELASQKGWSETFERYNNERTWTVLDTIAAIGKETGKTAAQVALNWLLRQPGVTGPIVGARNMQQLEDNIGATGWALSDEHVRKLTAASEPKELPYPYDIHRVRLGI
jgi:aryl-alcohol dehydrogenase-like predicted oxidoreductase